MSLPMQQSSVALVNSSRVTSHTIMWLYVMEAVSLFYMHSTKVSLKSNLLFSHLLWYLSIETTLILIPMIVLPYRKLHHTFTFGCTVSLFLSSSLLMYKEFYMAAIVLPRARAGVLLLSLGRTGRLFSFFSGQKLEQMHKIINKNTTNNAAAHAQLDVVHVSG